MIDTTLVFIFRKNEVLLALKKRGHGEGKWTGPGGKIKSNETPLEAAVRETIEEVGVTPALNRELAIIDYHDLADGEIRIHVFRATSWKGEPVESEEMKPQWFSINDIPYHEMWAGDDQWLDNVISDHPFAAEIWTDGKGGVTKMEIKD